MSDDRERASPSAVAAAVFLFVVMLIFAYLSPRPWSAAGLACVSASALVATPELIQRLLLAGSHPRAQKAARAISRVFWFATRFFYTVVAFAALLLVVGAASGALAWDRAIAAVLVAGIVIVAGEFVRHQLAGTVAALIGGDVIDERLRERHGEWHWPVAGALFLVGTVLQLVGTFVEQ